MAATQNPYLRAVVVACLILVAWGVTVAAGGSRTAAPHLFYLPVVLAALWYRPSVAVIVAALAGLVAGPLTPLDVATGQDQTLGNWLVRAGAFLVVSLVTSVIVSRQRDVAADRLRVADERHDLDRQRSALLQIIAHEIRTPVTVLKGSSELLAAGRAGDRSQDLVQAMRNAVRRLEDLAEVVTSAEDTDAVRDLPLGAIRVGEFIGRVVDDVSEDHDRARVRVAGDVGAQVTVAGPGRFGLALRLVLDNALRFSDEPVEVVAAHRDGTLVVTVADRGPGIPDGVWAAASPFQQGDASTTRRHGGLGVGLYAARKLVAATGGRMVLDDNGPQGARVSLEIPAPPARVTDARWS